MSLVPLCIRPEDDRDPGQPGVQGLEVRVPAEGQGRLPVRYVDEVGAAAQAVLEIDLVEHERHPEPFLHLFPRIFSF